MSSNSMSGTILALLMIELMNSVVKASSWDVADIVDNKSLSLDMWGGQLNLAWDVSGLKSKWQSHPFLLGPPLSWMQCFLDMCFHWPTVVEIDSSFFFNANASIKTALTKSVFGFSQSQSVQISVQCEVQLYCKINAGYSTTFSSYQINSCVNSNLICHNKQSLE